MATALPCITGGIGSLQHLSWVVTSFIVASTVSAPLYGKLSGLYGREPAFIASISISLVGSALCGFAGSMGRLIAFRTAQGLGAGGLIVLAQTAIGDLVSPRERGRYQGMFAVVLCGMLGGRTATGRYQHRICLPALDIYVNLPVGGAALAFIAGRQCAAGSPGRDSADHRHVQSSLAAQLGRHRLWLVLSAMLGLALGAIESFIALAFVERQATQPILPPELFGNSVFVVGAAVIALAIMALFAAVVFLPLMFQLLMDACPTQAA